MSDNNSAIPADSEETKPAKKVAAKKATKKTAKKAAKKTARKVAKKAPVTSTKDVAPAKEAKPKEAAKEAPNKEPKPQQQNSDAPAKSENKQSELPLDNNQNSNQNQNQNQNQQSENKAPKQGRQPNHGRVKGHNNANNRQGNNQGNSNGQNNNQGNNNQNSNQGNNNKQGNNNNRRNNNNKNQRGKNNNNNNRNKNNNPPRNNNNNNNNQQRREKKVELTGPPVEVNGMLELAPKGFGFLRTLDRGLEQASDDVFVTPDLIRTHGLRLGVWIHGEAMQGPKGLQLINIKQVNGQDPEESRKLPHFEELKAVNPNKRISFETTADRFTTRVVDIIAPVGRGQRGLIVSPPRSGKTTMMMHMAEAVQEKYEDTMHLIILLVDERPEEVTEFKHQLPEAEIFASSNDAGAKNHCRVAELCIERAKRLVEAGEHVFILMDSITRLARAYNSALGGEKAGRGKGIQSGGIITGALEMPRRIFAAARNTRTAGSLTIVATALVHTNSRADDAIFQEFKGTGNMELVLDRRIAEKYIYPAVDIFKSGTRREELLLADISLHKIHLIRRGLAGHRPEEAMERLTFFLKRFNNNAQMLMEIKG